MLYSSPSWTFAGVLATPLLIPCCALFMLHSFHVALFPYCTLLMLHFFNVAVFSCCTFVILRNIENDQKTENTIKNNITLSIVNLFHFFFDILQHKFVIFEWLIKWKGTNYLFVGQEYVYQSLKLLKLGCELKFISLRHKVVSISCRYFNCDIENKWTQKTYTCVEKLGSALSTLFWLQRTNFHGAKVQNK